MAKSKTTKLHTFADLGDSIAKGWGKTVNEREFITSATPEWMAVCLLAAAVRQLHDLAHRPAETAAKEPE